MQRTFCGLLGVLMMAATASAAPTKGLTIQDMLAMQRVGDPVVSPDGKRAAFTVRDTDYEANRGRFDIYVVAVDGSSEPVRLTSHPENDTDPAWSPDGRWIYFLSSRSGSSQVWRIAPSGGEAEPVTKLPVDLNGFEIFPDGKRLALTADVYPDAKTLAETVKRDGDKAKSKVVAKIYTELFFRHWDTWEDGKFSHLFVWDPAKADDLRDLTPGLATDTPVKPFGGMDDISIAPDGKSLVYLARVGGREQAWTTNTDAFLVAADGRSKPVDLTLANKAYDFSPTYSPDGTSLAIGMMVRPGYEADRTRLAIIDMATKKVRVVTEAWDASVGGFEWAKDGKTIYTTSDHVGNHAVFAIDVATGAAKLLAEKGLAEGPRRAGDRLVYSRNLLDQPTELFTMKLDGSDVKQITHFNDARVKAIAWGAYEQFSFVGAHGDTVYGYAMKPAGFVAGQKYPIAFLIHGGPQGSFGNDFHYRWNPEVFAGHGYGTVFIDFHGSTGYGQKFVDAINGDWGGAPYEDLMKGLDAATAKYPWLDGKNAVALGASYGGFMINWINGNTDRFKALVCHDGNNDERSAYLATEELWFPEWEHGGTPWEKPAGYAKDEPFDLIKNWKTPTLVIHSGQDFRVVETEGMATFTALQRKGVPSRFLYFPDENHWVVKPQNSKLWHDEVLSWIDRYTKKR